VGGRGVGPLKGQCSAIKPNGERCQRSVEGPHGLCWAHAPENASKRQWMASKAGKGKAGSSKVTKELHELLEDLLKRVVGGELETPKGAVAAQLVNCRIRLIDLERRTRETEELAERIGQLETVAQEESRGRGGGWGA
jgi:hypothetical protein